MSARRVAATALAAAALTVTAATPAFAGEVNGNGKDLPLKGASECKYSGLNDEMTEEEPFRTQSYGTIVAFLVRATGMNPPALGAVGIPGDACNPNGGGFEE
ncbi:hypothetical protein [Phycicoccus flavus]|uniref:hypothetical protein n=1 Tax=Phycicoccus flavus TaxID=2502783 RepID=UPI000FEBBAD6|nr:hypothetical protein [Phycicoccus flavus]NHA69347.1 hypothetical protein [Phycicoccus flavus]